MADSRCDWVRQELAEVRRGRASAEVAGRVEAHLAECAACRAEANWDQRLGATLTQASIPATAGNLEGRVHRLLRRRRWLRGAAISTAAAAVIGVASFALFNPRPPTRPGGTEVVQAPPDAVVVKELDAAVNESPVARASGRGGQAMSTMMLTLILAQVSAEPPGTALTEDQIARLRALVRDTQERATALSTQLEAKERELAQVYFEYEFRERQAAALEAEIVQLQREKLANYHRMHAELRTIVGKERFDVLKQRLRLAGFFGPAGKEPKR